MTKWQPSVLRRFAELVTNLVVPRSRGKKRQAFIEALERLAADVLRHLDTDEEQHLLLVADHLRARPKLRPPPEDLALLGRVFGRHAIRLWVTNKHPGADPSRVEALAREWLGRLDDALREQLYAAALRFVLAEAGPGDQQLLEKSFEDFEKEKEKKMATFAFDTRGLPSRLTNSTAQAAYVQKVKDILQNTYGLDLTTTTGTPPVLTNLPTLAYVVGRLLQREVFDETAASFGDSVGTAWTASLAKVKTEGVTDGTPLRMVLPDIIKVLDPGAALTTGTTTPVTIFYQALASIADYVAANAESVPYKHASFNRQVEIGMNRYVSGPPPAESLDLPPLTGVGAADVEYEPENLRAVGVVYLALQMDRMRLFHVLDRITYHYMQGLLALPYDTASRAIDEYYWNSEDRLNEAARNMIYGRVLGAPGTDVSKDVQPNKDWDSVLPRFIASVGEFDREQRVADLFKGLSSARPASASHEQIRKAGRDLMSNASLYGWGGTQACARRIKEHVILCLNILRMPQLQKIYGVTSPYQVIERVTMNEFGQAPNIVKYRTMAESGKKILDVLARNVDKFATTTSNPLLSTSTTTGDISLTDTQILINECNSWLAVNAIPAEQTEKMSQPVDTRYNPSMPTAGTSPQPAGSPDLVEKLQQMVKSGSAPSLDQLQQLLPAFK